jgi:hypothetical protein
MKKVITYFFVLTFILACGSSKKLNEADFSTFKNKIEEKKLDISFEWANPIGLGNVQGIDALFINGSNKNNINLIGNQNFFRIKKDSLHIELPYYGTHQISAPTPGANIGISFEGIPEMNFIEFNSEKQKAILKYDFRTKNDSYNVILTLFPSNKSYLSVNSDRKTAISYTGNWRVLK